jgi:spermidine/putrescine transport system substrate-binding protein
MKRRTFFLGMAGLSGCTRDTRPRLNVYNWSEYIAAETISRFEEATGARVHYSIYESNEELLAKIFSGNSGWDVVFPSHYYVAPMQENGLLAPLNSSQLPLLSNLTEDMQHPVWDTNLDWCMPYMLGGAGIIHQVSLKVEEPSWQLLWRDDLRGKVTMLDDPADSIGAALLKLGYPLNATESTALEHAKQELIRQKKILRAYLNSESRQALVAGDLLASHLWATTSLLAIAETDQLTYYYPREGFARYADCAVILKESKRRDLAHEFLNFLLRPEIAAANAKAAMTTTPNALARELLPPSLRESAVLFPDAETLALGQWFAALSPEGQRLRDRIWTEVKAH